MTQYRKLANQLAELLIEQAPGTTQIVTEYGYLRCEYGYFKIFFDRYEDEGSIHFTVEAGNGSISTKLKYADFHKFSIWWKTTSTFDSNWSQYFTWNAVPRTSPQIKITTIINKIYEKSKELPINVIKHTPELIKYKFGENIFVFGGSHTLYADSINFNGIDVVFPCFFGGVDYDYLVNDVLFPASVVRELKLKQLI
jgi:hypothetical protein